MSAAACWEAAEPNLPADIRAALESANDPALAGLELLVAIPEWEVALPGGGTASQTDVMAITRNAQGLVILGVEAKVDETFGPTLKEKKAQASKGQLDRIAFLERELGRDEPFPGRVRYQLLHRTVSALLTARAFHAPVAVMLVHSFCPKSRWRADFSAFCDALKCQPLSTDLFETPRMDSTRLILGWCCGRVENLTAEWPSFL